MEPGVVIGIKHRQQDKAAGADYGKDDSQAYKNPLTGRSITDKTAAMP